ncbi:hypothetical protein Pmani_038206 [Petrolisthes manimaculis]|uniref:Uncharacterized protein n=1 Tax=Petrolisthes manimaculis TaxID=1843537 RepID=A0AAE1NFR1_9EUCA|nr:hypothetical protein Pmani_038206 [Petrolisthes manimaculis]
MTNPTSRLDPIHPAPVRLSPTPTPGTHLSPTPTPVHPAPSYPSTLPMSCLMGSAQTTQDDYRRYLS